MRGGALACQQALARWPPDLLMAKESLPQVPRVRKREKQEMVPGTIIDVCISNDKPPARSFRAEPCEVEESLPS